MVVCNVYIANSHTQKRKVELSLGKISNVTHLFARNRPGICIKNNYLQIVLLLHSHDVQNQSNMKAIYKTYESFGKLYRNNRLLIMCTYLASRYRILVCCYFKIYRI